MLVLLAIAGCVLLQATVLLLRFYWQDMLKGFMMLQAVWQPPITITITTTTGKIILLLMLVATAKVSGHCWTVSAPPCHGTGVDDIFLQTSLCMMAGVIFSQPHM